MRPVRIAATGHYLPPVVLDNQALIERFGLEVDAEWIESRTGIRTRHWMGEDQTTSDMAAEAAKAVLREADLGPRDLDRIILATVSPDRPSPATATTVARKIGARCPAFDVSAACAGLLYGLDLARGAIACGEERVLVLCADARSRFIDPSDRRGTVLFADGAAGALVVPSERPGLLSVSIGAEGLEDPGAWVPAGGAELPASAETVQSGGHYLQVSGFREIFERFKAFTREGVGRALELAQQRLEDVDVFITHQGNAFLVDEIVADLGLDPARGDQRRASPRQHLGGQRGHRPGRSTGGRTHRPRQAGLDQLRRRRLDLWGGGASLLMAGSQGVALLTGASGGLGPSLARALGDSGFAVALLGRERAKLEALAAEVPGARPWTVDLREPAALEPLVQEYGDDVRVVLHGAAAFAPYGRVEQLREEDLQQVLQVGLAGALRLARSFAAGMGRAGLRTPALSGQQGRGPRPPTGRRPTPPPRPDWRDWCGPWPWSTAPKG